MDQTQSPSEPTQNPRRQQQQYWQAMTELKLAACYIQLYRDYLHRWVTGLGVIKAVASSVGIAAWAILRQYAFIWALIIAASQVADALKDVFPFTKRHKAASELTSAYTSLFIDAQFEWENIVSGRFAGDQIISRAHKLRKLEFDAERSAFPDGLEVKADLKNRAEQDTEQYFSATYQV